ncbi:MAG: PDZ domain-containing protein, partial [Armatimonadota bacterium]|nr:PDZ domain-containing protein [Armatimonadota bacterium]
NLTGYSAKEIKVFTSLVKQRANLVPHPRYKHRYVPVGAIRVAALIPAPDRGIGITFERDLEGQLLVATIEDHSPAAEAGLMQGDHILSINRLETDNLDEASAACECRRPEGALISLKVERELWHKPLEFTVRTRSGFD